MPKRSKSPSNPMVFLCSALLLLLSGVLFGQVTNVTYDTSTPIPGAGHDYIKMMNETVNPANGSLSIRIQLAVPKGRQLTVPFSFAYDSNGVYHFMPTSPGYGTWVSNTTFVSQGGWSYSVPMASFLPVTEQYLYPNRQTGPQSLSCSYATDYMFNDPSGGRHSLWLAWVEPTQGTNNCSLSPYTPPSTFLSGGDDSFLASLPGAGNIDWSLTVSDLDGTVYSFPNLLEHSIPYNGYAALPTTITDRNGNQVSVTDEGL